MWILIEPVCLSAAPATRYSLGAKTCSNVMIGSLCTGTFGSWRSTVMLSNLTDEARKTRNERPERVQEVNQDIMDGVPAS